jgi:chromosome segregation protein
LIGGIDDEVITEHKEVSERYEFLSVQVKDLEKAIEDLDKVVAELDEVITKQFNSSFKKINQAFGIYFEKVFGGGKARLEILQKEKPAEQPLNPQEQIPSDQNLPEEESLICAIIDSNPAPFIVMDEVDAALDEANSEKLAEILQALSYKSQFVVITHNRVIMHVADVLYGVAMGDDGVSRTLSLDMKEAEKTVKA